MTEESEELFRAMYEMAQVPDPDPSMYGVNERVKQGIRLGWLGQSDATRPTSASLRRSTHAETDGVPYDP